MNAEADLATQLLDHARDYNQTLALRLGLPYDTVKDAAALCDALAPRLKVESAAVDAVHFLTTALPDVLPIDEDGHKPAPGRALLLMAQEVINARGAIAKANEALTAAKAEADGLRSTLAATQADLLATDRACDSWRDAASTTAKALSAAAAALADVAAIR